MHNATKLKKKKHETALPGFAFHIPTIQSSAISLFYTTCNTFWTVYYSCILNLFCNLLIPTEISIINSCPCTHMVLSQLQLVLQQNTMSFTLSNIISGDFTGIVERKKDVFPVFFSMQVNKDQF